MELLKVTYFEYLTSQFWKVFKLKNIEYQNFDLFSLAMLRFIIGHRHAWACVQNSTGLNVLSAQSDHLARISL